MSKKRKITRINKRVRFCSLDYYRTLVTGTPSDIAGIKSYICTDNTIVVQYANDRKKTYFVNEGEHQLKEVIKIINKYLGGEGDGTQQQLA